MTSLSKSRRRTAQVDQEDPLKVLLRSQILQISSAFDKAAARSESNSRASQPSEPSKDVQNESRNGGGFMVDEDPSSGVGAGAGGFLAEDMEGGFLVGDVDIEMIGGGFLPEHDDGGGGFLSSSGAGHDASTSDTPDDSNLLPLSQLSYALTMLPPSIMIPTTSQSELYDLFRSISSSKDGEEWITKDDFLRFCAAFARNSSSSSSLSEVEGGKEEEETESETTERRKRRKRKHVSYAEDDEDDDGSSTGYLYEREGEDSDSEFVMQKSYKPEKRKTRSQGPADEALYIDDDESYEGDGYQPTIVGEATTGKGKGKKRRKSKFKSEKDLRQASDKAFDMFLLEGGGGGRQTQKIGFDHLKRVAEMLGEKLSDDDIIEMLDYAKDGGSVGRDKFLEIFRNI